MKRKRCRHTVFSSIPDEELALIIAEDYKNSPGEFSYGKTEVISDSAEFVSNTSARGINPMKKWL